MGKHDDYSDMTQEDYDTYLLALTEMLSSEKILQLAYEQLSEELHDDVLDRWREDHPKNSQQKGRD